MAGTIVLAVAGAGKTYYICHTIDPAKRNLVLAFTRENVVNILRELNDAFGSVPKSTTVMTFDSFVLHNFILPYEPTIAYFFNHPRFSSNGITMTDPPKQSVKCRNGQGYTPNPLYFKKSELLHYIDKSNRYYCATLSELALHVKKGKSSLFKRAAKRLRLFYDSILIDEFQDFRCHDYDLIVKLSKELPEVILVGDYYQHSVSATNNSGKPYTKNGNEVGYVEFTEQAAKDRFLIKEDLLLKSRRCSIEVCEFVSRKLEISIESANINEGHIIWVDEEIEEVLADDEILKLVYNNSSMYSFRSMNWSYSKGNTVDAACVILTEGFEELDEDTFSPQEISQSTINKLYVALTRSRGNVYLIKASDFNRVKSKYSSSSGD